MNKREDDFETLRDYNDYLEQVEDITWNLILKVDVEETEHRLRRWEEHQAAQLHPGATRRPIDPDPSLPTDTAHVVLKKGGTQRKAAANTTAAAASSTDTAAAADKDKGFAFRGLKKRVAPPPEAPFDPFGGWALAPTYYALQDDYDVEWLTAQKNDAVHTVGGYDMRDFYNRALRDAFGGLGLFVQDEVEARSAGSMSMDADVATNHAAAVAAVGGGRDVAMDDVF
jgi:CDK-activating kinase assembly factor MAT1